MTSRVSLVTCVLLLAAMAVNMVMAIGAKTITVDETVLIPSGYYHLTRGYSSLIYEHPPLPKVLAAAPLLAFDVRTVDTPDRRLRNAAEPDAVTRFWDDNAVSIDRLAFWARVPAIALTVILGLAIFAFARALFGTTAAVLAVALFTLEATVLAHGRVAQTDMPSALGYLLLLWSLYRYLQQPSAARALAMGAVGGLACLTKFSMILAGPILAGVFVLAAYRQDQHRQPLLPVLGHMVLAAAAALLIINAAYPIHSRALAEWEIDALRALYPGGAPYVLAGLDALSYLLPTDFMAGILNQYVHNQFGHASSLLGMHAQHGWRYYFAAAFALKVPIPILILALAALGWCGTRAVRFRDARCILLLAGFVIYFGYCSFSRIAIGVRYLLPVYPLLFIMIGATLDAMMRLRRTRIAAMTTAAIALLWTAVEAARSYPDYIPYMSQIARNQPPYRYLSDSNVEWGDDVRGLAEFLRTRGEARVQGAFMNSSLMPAYGIAFVDLLSPAPVTSPKTNYVALGAAYLNGSGVTPAPILGQVLPPGRRINYFDAYRKRQPERVIGGSIYVYRNE